jgi:hypothetical protein
MQKRSGNAGFHESPLMRAVRNSALFTPFHIRGFEREGRPDRSLFRQHPKAGLHSVHLRRLAQLFPPGLKKDGETCLWYEQCESGLCDIPNYATGNHCGTCAPAVGGGEVCTIGCGLNADPSGHHLTCVPDTSGVARCVPLGTEGDRCDAVGCEPGFFCKFDEVSGTRSCHPAAGVGDACTSNNGFCDAHDTLLCSSSTGTCVPPRVVGEGELCGMIESPPYFTVCDEATSCDLDFRIAMTAICRPAFIPDGSACPVDPSTAPSTRARLCEFPAICTHAPVEDTGTCRIVGTDYCR